MQASENVDVHEKCIKYLQILRRYLFFEQKDSGSANQSASEKHKAEEPVEKVFLETEIVEALPASYRAKASKLFKNLKKDDRFSWNDTGEVKIDGKALQNLNILDLLSYVVKKPIRLDVPPPVGRVELYARIGNPQTTRW